MFRRNIVSCIYILIVMAIVFFMIGCSGGNDEENGSEKEDGKINIVTTIAQIGEPLSVIGGEHVRVKSLMGPGVDPHLY